VWCGVVWFGWCGVALVVAVLFVLQCGAVQCGQNEGA
jgi:hypothetical protein